MPGSAAGLVPGPAGVLHVHLRLPLDPSPGHRLHPPGHGVLLLHGLHHGGLCALLHPQSERWAGQFFWNAYTDTFTLSVASFFLEIMILNKVNKKWYILELHKFCGILSRILRLRHFLLHNLHSCMCTCLGWTEAAILKTVLMMMSASMAICCVTARPGASQMDTVISFLAFLLLEVTRTFSELWKFKQNLIIRSASGCISQRSLTSEVRSSRSPTGPMWWTGSGECIYS